MCLLNQGGEAFVPGMRQTGVLFDVLSLCGQALVGLGQGFVQQVDEEVSTGSLLTTSREGAELSCVDLKDLAHPAKLCILGSLQKPREGVSTNGLKVAM